MEQRELGKTGAKLSVVGLGGIALTNETEEECSRIVSEAIERGVSYFDVAPSYGNAEELMGPALKPAGIRSSSHAKRGTGRRTGRGRSCSVHLKG